MKPGDEVSTDYRCPMDHAHPDCWGEPHKGILLENNDPRAWAGTVAMAYNQNPTQKQVDAHLKQLEEREIPLTSLPVLYTFDGVPTAMWETKDKVRPYAEVLYDWKLRRQQAFVKMSLTSKD